MVSATSCHESYSPLALYHILSSSVDMGVVVVATNSFVTSTLTRSSVPLVLSRDILHGSVLSQTASSFGCAASSCSTIVAGQK